MSGDIKIPKHIRKKLEQIEAHQHKVVELIGSVLAWKEALRGVCDEENGWSWGMHINQQEEIWSAKDSEDLLEDYLHLIEELEEEEEDE